VKARKLRLKVTEAPFRNDQQSLFFPDFLFRLADPSVRTVMLCGCGGGFDFVHSMILYPELRRLGKRVVIGSYSFGDPHEIGGDAPVVFDEEGVVVKRVTAASVPDPYYGPEVHVCSYLDSKFPQDAPHFAYAYYARAFCVPLLQSLYRQFTARHSIDALVLFDGGSDSLMVGNEEGLGDPIEDCVSVTTVASLAEIKVKILISIGFGCDRHNHVSDAASLRAISELTAQGGFLGAVGMQPTSPGFCFYRDCLDHIYARQGFHSVIGGAITSAAEGHFGSEHVPSRLESRVDAGEMFLWPLMAVLWAFDVEAVARRSLMSKWIGDKTTVRDCYDAVFDGRQALGDRVRGVENCPRHEEMRGQFPNIWQLDE
jgi:hypothetical protein